MAMPPLRFPVAVTIERAPLTNRWVSEQWRIATVEPADDHGQTACERLADDGNVARWRCRGLAIELTRSEAEGYYLNISSPEPKAFVMCRMEEGGSGADPELKLRAHLVTVSYNEAGRFLDGGEQVDAVALHPAILAWMQPFVAEHYRPEPRRKVRRNELYERDGDVVPRAKPDR
ncbi:MAG TPA: DUF3305 domain-containing protein [Casimicrobiaceae bacterium]|nr:DUF3305 domain-containing protein [Casimicrobiaceae bacterium]